MISFLLQSAFAAPAPAKDAAGPTTEPVQILEAPGDSSSTSPILAAIVIAIIILIFYLWSSGNTKRISTKISKNVSKMYYNMGIGDSQKGIGGKSNLQASDVKDSLTLAKAKPALEISPRYNVTKPQESYSEYRKSYQSGEFSEYEKQVISNDSVVLRSPRSPVSVKIKSPGLKAKDIPLDTLYGRVFKNNLKFFK